MKNEQRESYTEVLTILNYMETEYQQKIPKKLIDFLKRNSAKDYKFDIDLAIPLKTWILYSIGRVLFSSKNSSIMI